MVKGEVGGWTVLQAWSTSDTAVWDTTGYVGVSNRVGVIARNRTYHDGEARKVVQSIEITQ